MRKIFILQNSYVSFGLDVEKIYQPHKYQLYLIINEFGMNIVKEHGQIKFYSQICVTKNFDFENILALIKSFSQSNESIDVVTNSEETMPVCGKIRKFLNIDKNDYSRFYDKHIMKSMLVNSKNINIPKYKIFEPARFFSDGIDYLNELAHNLVFPLFVKPIQMYSSINIRKLDNFDQLHNWAKLIKSDDYYEIDEFIDGTMYQCDSYIKNGEILFTFVCQNSRPCYDFTIGKMKGTIVLPSEHSDALLLSAVTKKTLEQLGMPKAGVTHLELIRTKENVNYFIEIAHRSPGCLVPKMHLTNASIDTISAHFLLQIDPNYYPTPMRNVFAAWACYPKIPGKVTTLKLLPTNLKSKCEVEWNVKVGDQIKTFSQFGRDYTGTIFMTNHNFDTLYNEFKIINDMDLCKTEPIS